MSNDESTQKEAQSLCITCRNYFAVETAKPMERGEPLNTNNYMCMVVKADVVPEKNRITSCSHHDKILSE